MQGLVRIVVLGGFLSLASGCGSSVQSAAVVKPSGTVTFQGRPVQAGTVWLVNDSRGQSASAKIVQEGRFEFQESVQIGTYKAVITPPENADPTGEKLSKIEVADIPVKYRSEETTDLRIDLKTNPRGLKLELQ